MKKVDLLSFDLSTYPSGVFLLPSNQGLLMMVGEIDFSQPTFPPAPKTLSEYYRRCFPALFLPAF